MTKLARTVLIETGERLVDRAYIVLGLASAPVLRRLLRPVLNLIADRIEAVCDELERTSAGRSASHRQFYATTAGTAMIIRGVLV